MSLYGINIYNANGQLVTTSIDGTSHLHWIGTATYTGNDGRFQASYQISSVYKPIAFIYAVGNQYYKSFDSYTIGANLWQVNILDSNGSANTFTNPSVWCFAALSGVGNRSTNYGLQIYKADGSKSFDSTNNPLVLDYSFNVPAQSSGQNYNANVGSIPGVNAAGIYFPGRGFGQRVVPAPGNVQRETIYSKDFGFRLNGTGGTINCASFETEVSTEDIKNPASSTFRSPAQQVWVTDLSRIR